MSMPEPFSGGLAPSYPVPGSGSSIPSHPQSYPGGYMVIYFIYSHIFMTETITVTLTVMKC